MKRTEWLIKLEQELIRLKVPQPREIVADYEEHFAAAMEARKSEEDTAAKLGDPKTVAGAHSAEYLMAGASPTVPLPPAAAIPFKPDLGNMLRASLRLLVLTPFNFLMLVGPFLIFCLFLIVGWTIAGAMTGASAGAILLGVISLPFMVLNFWLVSGLFFGAMAFIGFTVLTVMTMSLLTKWILQIFASYLRWNVDFVLEKRSTV